MVSDALWLRFVRRCSFQVRVNPIERWDFAQKTLKIPVERLVPLHLWIPAHANRRDVPAARRLERGEVELQTPFCVLLVLQAPARHSGNGRSEERRVGKEWRSGREGCAWGDISRLSRAF